MGELLRYVVRHEIGHALGSAAQLQGHGGGRREGAARSAVDPHLGHLGVHHELRALQLRRAAGRRCGPAAAVRPLRLLRHRVGLPRLRRGHDPGARSAPSSTRSPRARSPIRCCASAAKTRWRSSIPTVFSNVVGGDAIESADLGLRNIDRVMAFIVPATTRTGESYDRLSEMYEALVQQRHRELVYVAKLVGGVEETRYQAGRGKAPFVPVAPERQRQAVKLPGRARLRRAQDSARSRGDRPHHAHRAAAIRCKARTWICCSA